MLALAALLCVVGMFFIFLSGMIFCYHLPKEKGKLNRKTFTDASSVVGTILLVGLLSVGASVAFMGERFSRYNPGKPAEPSILTEICRLEGVVRVDDWNKNVAVVTNSAGRIICVITDHVPKTNFIKWSALEEKLWAVNPSIQELPKEFPEPNTP